MLIDEKIAFLSNIFLKMEVIIMINGKINYTYQLIEIIFILHLFNLIIIK